MRLLLSYYRDIAVTDADRLADVVINRAEAHGLPAHGWERLPLAGYGSLECASKTDNGAETYTTTLNFRLTGRWTPQGRRLAFLVTTVRGRQFLVGHPSGPEVKVSTALEIPAREAEPVTAGVTAELADTIGVLDVPDPV